MNDRKKNCLCCRGLAHRGMPLEETAPRLLFLDYYQDGGTQRLKIKLSTGEVVDLYIDYRISSHEKCRIFLYEYPHNTGSVIVDDATLHDELVMNIRAVHPSCNILVSSDYFPNGTFAIKSKFTNIDLDKETNKREKSKAFRDGKSAPDPLVRASDISVGFCFKCTRMFSTKSCDKTTEYYHLVDESKLEYCGPVQLL